RLGIQAFEPVLVEGRAIKLHPLVCTAFNADFDGDQMAVHVPLSAEAQAEARFLMLAANNLLKPQDGKPVTVPTQDMVLGSYYLTMQKDGEPGEGKVFRDKDEVIMAYESGVISLHAAVKVRVSKEIDGEVRTGIIDATAGRIIFNERIPQDLGFVDRSDPAHALDLEITFVCGKKQLGKIIEKCIKVHGPSETAEVLDSIKSLGYRFSTRGAITVSVADMTVPPKKKEIIADAEQKVDKIVKQFKRGLITDEERYGMTVATWDQATKDVTAALREYLDQYNPIKMMADSGARGSIDQIRQLAGMRGLMANTSQKTIEVPIKANFREGLNVLEYFISSRGARKGLADTALRTADSGYLTRRLVDVSQDVIVREEDCWETADPNDDREDGILVSEIKNVESLEERLYGRFAAEDICNPETGEVIVPRNALMRDKEAKAVVDAGVKEAKIRSVITCKSKHGVCAKCYGLSLANDREVNIGEAVGIIAAQAIGEPGTQLTMRTFHTGGIAGGDDITQGLPRVEELFEARKPKSLAVISEIGGEVEVYEEKGQPHIKVTGGEEDNFEVRIYPIVFDAHIRVKTGDVIKKGDTLTEGSVNPHDILRVCGSDDTQNYLIKEVQKVYRLQGVDINDKHIEVIVRQMMKKVRVDEEGDTPLLLGDIIDRVSFERENKKIEKRIEEGEITLRKAVATPVLLGITKASLATDSFLSAASFQETTRVLTEAAIEGKVDPLLGLKENVIIGKLVPAGTGMDVYRNVEIETDMGDASEGYVADADGTEAKAE
ncbi:MAG: DNA-directed RNA polymerase subunit beta', partial [Lachnospiraceae bacterium]|nr:DNA-directed RNA polymerase subunit beta' [Lachnospiraceae bacterium]